jgi:3-phosphoshikimate 1-carboxyvinyltransferase
VILSFDAPGDKSLSHRVLLLGPLAEGRSCLRGVSPCDDVRCTRRALEALGVRIEGEGDETLITGPARWRPPPGEIDCGNSGTTARLLLGLLSGLGLPAVLCGDASLSGRPMDRVVYPLQAMGARIRYLKEEDRLPVALEARRSGSLRSLRHRPRVASAQVKSSLLLAGLASAVPVEVIEPTPTRDHTERLLQEMGAPLSVARMPGGGSAVALESMKHGPALRPLDLGVPGDFSAAASLLAAAWLGAGEVRVVRVGLNARRTGLLRAAAQMGARFEVGEEGVEAGEPMGTLRGSPSRLRASDVGGRLLVDLVDEVPVLAVLAARASGVSRIRGAAELRRKESDRLSTVAAGLQTVGVRCREHSDGLDIEGTDAPLAGVVRTGGDHRIAMAFGVLGAAPGCEITVDDPMCVSISYPGFWRDLERLAGRSGA